MCLRRGCVSTCSAACRSIALVSGHFLTWHLSSLKTFVHSFIHSFIHSEACSAVHASVQSVLCSSSSLSCPGMQQAVLCADQCPCFTSQYPVTCQNLQGARLEQPKEGHAGFCCETHALVGLGLISTGCLLIFCMCVQGARGQP